MTARTRPIIVAVAFAATVAAAVTGATLRGETREAPTVAELCAKAEWPMIPTECLDGAGDRAVRIVTGNEAAAHKIAAADMDERFAVAFQ
jgi:predicted homoserine dehydrogenase-like protein